MTIPTGSTGPTGPTGSARPTGVAGNPRHDTARARLGPGDTPADDCAMDLLGDLDESLWIYDDVRRADGHAFRHARRQDDHAEEMRRILYRLHRILVDWEAEALIR